MTTIRTYNFRGKRLAIYELEGGSAGESGGGLAASIRAPGAGQITIHSLQAAATRRASGVRIALSGVVEGGPIASLAVELLLHDPEQGQAYGPVHTQYLATSEYREAAGRRIPLWTTPLTVQTSLAVGLRLISDGKTGSLARLRPAQPGAVGARLALEANGEHIPAGGGAARRARAVFGPGRKLQDLLAYAGQGLAQTPKAVLPQAGDAFRPYLRVFSLDGGEADEGREAAGDLLTLGAAGLHWYAAPLWAGEYLVGLAVSDLDGRVQQALAGVKLS